MAAGLKVWTIEEQLDAELLDAQQHVRLKQGKPMHVRTRETQREYPLPGSRVTPKLICPYCGRKRCTDHAELPALDPFYER